jgi:hypothetical protein
MTKRHVHRNSGAAFLRLNSGAVFLRCALAFFVVRELAVWRWIRRFRVKPARRLLIFLFQRGATPRSLFYALLFAGLATLLLELLVRLVIRPLVRHWHEPWTDGSAGLFHLAANERVVASSPARRKSGWSWPAGTLICTNLRLWFFPRAHDAEIWSRPLAALEGVRLEPAPRIAWGLIAGWPDRLTLEDGDGSPEVFAVPDPDAVLPWFQPGQVQARATEVPRPAAPPHSTRRRL